MRANGIPTKLKTTLIVIAAALALVSISNPLRAKNSREQEPRPRQIFGSRPDGSRVKAINLTEVIKHDTTVNTEGIILVVVNPETDCLVKSYYPGIELDEEGKIRALRIAQKLFRYDAKIRTVEFVCVAYEHHKQFEFQFTKQQKDDLDCHKLTQKELVENIKVKVSPHYLPDYQRVLLGDYKLVRNNFKEAVITEADGKHVLWNGNVESLLIRAPYVTGSYIPDEGFRHTKKKIASKYFLLNTATHNLKTGLSENDWCKALDQINWKNPKLLPTPQLVIDPLPVDQ